MFWKTTTISMNNAYMNKKFDFGIQCPYVFSKLLSKPRILNSEHIQHLYKPNFVLISSVFRDV